MAKQPLYPHVTKGRTKKGTNAWRCKQCGWTTWNVSECPRCGSRELEELTSEEVMQFYQTGRPVIHPRSEPIPPMEEKSEDSIAILYPLLMDASKTIARAHKIVESLPPEISKEFTLRTGYTTKGYCRELAKILDILSRLR